MSGVIHLLVGVILGLLLWSWMQVEADSPGEAATRIATLSSQTEAALPTGSPGTAQNRAWSFDSPG